MIIRPFRVSKMEKEWYQFRNRRCGHKNYTEFSLRHLLIESTKHYFVIFRIILLAWRQKFAKNSMFKIKLADSNVGGYTDRDTVAWFHLTVGITPYDWLDFQPQALAYMKSQAFVFWHGERRCGCWCSTSQCLMKNGYTDVLQSAVRTGDTALTGVSFWKLHPSGNQNLLSVDDFYICKCIRWNISFAKEEVKVFLFGRSREMYNTNASPRFCPCTLFISRNKEKTSYLIKWMRCLRSKLFSKFCCPLGSLTFMNFELKAITYLIRRLIIGNSVNSVIGIHQFLFLLYYFVLGCLIITPFVMFLSDCAEWIHFAWCFYQIAPNQFTLGDASVRLRRIDSLCMMFLSDCAESIHSAWCFCQIAPNGFTLHDVSVRLSRISLLCVMLLSDYTEWVHSVRRCYHI
jgi:hypothetical protein